MGKFSSGAVVLRLAMSTGFALTIWTTAGSLLCAVTFGNGYVCAPITPSMEADLVIAGFTVIKFVGSIAGGGLLYYITGKWKQN